MKRFSELVEAGRQRVAEIYPWHLAKRLESPDVLLVLDVREPYEFDAMQIAGALQVPRGILESACEWGYEETVPELVQARERELVVSVAQAIVAYWRLMSCCCWAIPGSSRCVRASELE